MFRVTRLILWLIALMFVVLIATPAAAQDATVEPTVEPTPTAVVVTPEPVQDADPRDAVIEQLQVTNASLQQAITFQNWLLAGALVVVLVCVGLLYRSAPPGVIKQFLGDFTRAVATPADEFVTKVETSARQTTNNFYDDLLAAGLRAGYNIVLQPAATPPPNTNPPSWTPTDGEAVG